MYGVCCFHGERVRLHSAPVSPGPQIPDNMPEVQNSVAPANARRSLQKTELEHETSNSLCLAGTFLGLGRSAASGLERAGGGRVLLVWNGVGLTEFPGFQIFFRKFPYFIPVVFNMKL